MILRNCRLIPYLCEGFDDKKADIRVEKDKIVEILPAGGNYTGEEVIECEGMTVMPGMSMLHVHIDMRTHDPKYVLTHKEPGEIMVNDIVYAQTLLAHGFTNVRDSGGPHALAMRLRDAVNAGEIVGPSIKAPGHILTPFMNLQGIVPSGNHSVTHDRSCNTVDECRREARKQLGEGADYIKLMGSPLRMDLGVNPIFCKDELKEFHDIAEMYGTYVGVHTTGPESNQGAIDMECGTIEHALNLSQENLDSIEKHGKKSQIVATMSICIPWSGNEITAKQHEGIKKASEMGVLIGWGTDVNMQSYLQDTALEFKCRRLPGWTDEEILKQATIDSAKINGEAAMKGSIKVGKKADFAIFRGNPDEDFDLFGRPCAIVIRNGEVVCKDGLVVIPMPKPTTVTNFSK